MNIGPHEVAFNVRKAVDNKFWHRLILDRLVLDYPDTIMWIGKHDGEACEAPYRTARERTLEVNLLADFAEAEERLFGLPGVRRALVAYWFEALADLRERNVKSVFARYHSYDAVSELLEYKRAREKVFPRTRSINPGVYAVGSGLSGGAVEGYAARAARAQLFA